MIFGIILAVFVALFLFGNYHVNKDANYETGYGATMMVGLAGLIVTVIFGVSWILMKCVEIVFG